MKTSLIVNINYLKKSIALFFLLSSISITFSQAPIVSYTPNNEDLINDVFEFKIPAGYTSSKFEIFSKWGQIIFSSTEKIIKWNGKINNTFIPTGVYPYVLSLITDRSSKNITGYITIP